MKGRLVLVDGNSLLHRAYHGYPLLRNKKGELTNAVYGFSSILLNTLEKIEATHVAVAWDVSKKTFRHDEFEGYKAGRKETDQELIDQFDRAKEVVSTLNIPQFGVKGYEADDLIGTLACMAKGGVCEKGCDCKDGKEKEVGQVIILTGDRDALQLVDKERVVVLMPSMGRNRGGNNLYDEKAVIAKYGLTPDQIIDLKGFMGDSSDNILGVRGVGQVTATKILQQGKTMEGVYEKLDKGELEVTERIKGLLKEGKKEAFKSKKLVTIVCDMSEVDFSWEKCRLRDYDKKKVMDLFEELEFRSLVARLPKDKFEEEVEEVFL